MDVPNYDHVKQLRIIDELLEDVRKYSNDTEGNRHIIFSLLEKMRDEIDIIRCNI